MYLASDLTPNVTNVRGVIGINAAVEFLGEQLIPVSRLGRVQRVYEFASSVSVPVFAGSHANVYFDSGSLKWKWGFRYQGESYEYL